MYTPCCRQAIELFVVLTPTSGGVPSSLSTHGTLPPPTTPHDSPPSFAITPSKPRLPKLLLPRFNGDVKGWSLFKSVIRDNADIPFKDKFNYLKSLLEGTAFKTV